MYVGHEFESQKSGRSCMREFGRRKMFFNLIVELHCKYSFKPVSSIIT